MKPVDQSEQLGDSIDEPKVTMSTTNAQTSLEHVQGPTPSEDIFSNVSQKANKKNAYLLTGQGVKRSGQRNSSLDASLAGSTYL